MQVSVESTGTLERRMEVQVPAVEGERVEVLVPEPGLYQRDPPAGVQRMFAGRQPVARE